MSDRKSKCVMKKMNKSGEYSDPPGPHVALYCAVVLALSLAFVFL